ncbi:hypothetical protein Asulf_00538 [Archaeoglobus sulfaticallidus PM70-1]|uniref:Cyclophilin TM1367-like domain-containing protein n=1 Tax=Archaeoglobus sulfaticallidus PM70-1 TaxID=387631 RepID=N0BAE2_9EURY|nr:cyclophilin-like fold protein [Archaeoglobus sulfaticallidus]AGK60559.1 hypothetical protein Asulf_00538 [Archaeoglobus sulfaticallidus PM70-1]
MFVRVGDIVREIELLPTKTAEIIKNSLPIRGIVNRWGDEIYFHTDIEVSEEDNSKEVVELGDVAYWIPGKAICIFFGKTPISDDKIRPASAVNVFGKVKGSLEELKSIMDGEEIELFVE